MAEQAQSRVQQAIKEFVNDVDQTHLRPMERNMHLCAADCCGKTTASIDDVHRYDRIKLKYNYSKFKSLRFTTIFISKFTSFKIDVLKDVRKVL